MTSEERHREELLARLEAAGKVYEAARISTDAARAAVQPLIVEALKAGISPGEVQRRGRLSHEAVRSVREKAGLPPAPRGGAR